MNDMQASTPGARLAAELDQATLYERRAALRTLLRQPLLTAGEEGFLLVRRHAGWLRDWLAKNVGWSLQVSSELARLRKTPEIDGDDGSRPAREPKDKTPFTRRRYVLLCLALAALHGADRQTTLGWLADKVLALTAGDPELAQAGLEFDLESRDQRRDLVQVVRLLLDLKVLARLDGDEDAWLQRGGGEQLSVAPGAARVDVLYNVHQSALAAILNVRRGPSTIDATGFEERLAALVEEPLPDTDEARNRRIRWRLTRLLLDDPVVEYGELDEDELAYLQKQRVFILGKIHEATGLVPEVRREGLALVDERGDLTDLKMPEQGTDGHLTLLVAEFLASHLRRAADADTDGEERPPAVTVGRAALEGHVAELVARHRRIWRRDVAEPGAEKRLAEQAVERLEALRLVRRGADGVVPRPALGRYGLLAPEEAAEGAQTSLPLAPVLSPSVTGSAETHALRESESER